MPCFDSTYDEKYKGPSDLFTYQRIRFYSSRHAYCAPIYLNCDGHALRHFDDLLGFNLDVCGQLSEVAFRYRARASGQFKFNPKPAIKPSTNLLGGAGRPMFLWNSAISFEISSGCFMVNAESGRQIA